MAVLIITGIVIFFQSNEALSAGYNWIQDDWSGGTSTSYPVHPGDRTSWDKYWSKGSNVNADASLTLATSSTLTEKSATLPQPVKDAPTCYDETTDKFYTFGGYYLDADQNVHYSSTTVQYDPTQDTATTSDVGKLPLNLRGHSCARASSTAIYLFGGYTGSSFNSTVYKFDPSNPSAQPVDTGFDIGQGRKDAPAVYSSDTGKIYLFGGYYLDGQTSNYVDKIVAFDPSDGSTSTVTTLPTSLRGISAALHPDNGKIYLFGGSNSSTFNADIYSFDPATDNVSDTNDNLPQGRTYSSTAYYSNLANKFYVLGGYSETLFLDNVQYLNTIVSYSTSTGVDTEPGTIFPSGGLSRASAAHSSQHNAVYVFGGYDGNNYSNKILSMSLNGTLTSSPYHTTDPGTVLNYLEWNENLPSDTELKFQIRTATSSDNGTPGDRSDDSPGNWTSWCGPDDGDSSTSTCASTTYFTGAAGTESMDEMFTDAVNDQWIQYKTFLIQEGVANTPTLDEVTFAYEANSEPELTQASAVQKDTGEVSFTYDIADVENTSATTTVNYDLGVTLSQTLNISTTTVHVSDPNNVLNLMSTSTTYTLRIEGETIDCSSKNDNAFNGCTRGMNNTSFYQSVHATDTTVWIEANNTAGEIGPSVISDVASTRSGKWYAKQDVNGFYAPNTARIRISATEKEPAWMVDYSDSSTFELDTENPTSNVSSLADWRNSTTWTVSWSGGDAGTGLDDYDVQYKKNDDNWVDCLSGTTDTSLTFPSDCVNTATVNSGDTFKFRSSALDNRDNREQYLGADASTTVDLVEPAVGFNSPATSSWYGSDFSVDFSDSDSLSGLSACDYRIKDDGEVSKSWTPRICDGSVTIDISSCTTEGVDTCKVISKATDNGGNVATSSRTFSIDSSVSNSFDSPAASSWQTDDFSVDTTDTDSASGVSSCEYRIDDGNDGSTTNWSPRTCSGTFSVSVGSEGECSVEGSDKCKVQIRTTDSVGNVATTNRLFGIDYNAPSGGSVNYTDGYTTVDSLSIELDDGSDDGSGLSDSSKELQRRNTVLFQGSCGIWGSWSTIASDLSSPYSDATVEAANCYQYRYLVQDQVGHQVTYSTSSVAKVDVVDPAGLKKLNADAASIDFVELSWQEVTEGCFDNYEIWYGTSLADVESRGASQWSTTTKSCTQATIGDLSSDTRYYFKIWASDTKGNESTVPAIKVKTTTGGYHNVEGVQLEGIQFE